MKAFVLAFLACFCVIGAAVAAPTHDPTFRIGDSPPPLAPMAWIKGDPVPEFRPGHVYVVKFFATWCGSSRQAMPRLSRLARQHAGQLTVIGVVIREDERGQPTLAAVTDFVNARGDDLSYTVAMDDPEKKTLYHAWMRASGMHGVPTAFIVGRDGKLAYVGYMMDDEAAYTFDTALAQALAGASDAAAARALQADVNRQTAERLREIEVMKPVREARNRGDYRTAVLEADKIIAAAPEFAWQAFSEKLAALLHIDEREALAFAQEQAQSAAWRTALNLEDATEFLGGVGRIIAQETNLSRDTYEQAAAYLQKSARSEDAMDWLLLARLYSMIGAFDRAVTAQEKAIAAARNTKDMPSESIARLESKLAEYKRLREAG